MNEPIKSEKITRCTKHVLSKDVCHANQLLPWIAQRRGMSYKWGGGASTHIGEVKYVQFIP